MCLCFTQFKCVNNKDFYITLAWQNRVLILECLNIICIYSVSNGYTLLQALRACVIIIILSYGIYVRTVPLMYFPHVSTKQCFTVGAQSSHVTRWPHGRKTIDTEFSLHLAHIDSCLSLSFSAFNRFFSSICAFPAMIFNHKTEFFNPHKLFPTSWTHKKVS